MGRFLLIAACLFLTACGDKSPPRNLEDACAIARERPKYMRAMERSERRWGVPVPVQMAVIHQESKFVGNARTPHRFVLGIIPMGRQSSAYGYAQAIDGTWDMYRNGTANRGARRDDIFDATDFMGWYMAESRKKLGIPLSDARGQYLAYHEGHAGYARRSYRSKAWLMAVANRVEDRAQLYYAQLITCRR
ncbi:lytic transglycosylase [Rhodovulum sulfidophilum]|uniref:transglycosylase SLT domain-containing protein n=1 Tax=Rhodovulum sulfidophilum TaxID=35806 RepID=UPI00192138F3|nr:lytic transglycosylase [Rhodovulum sulfidophilum]MBL3561016.1 lytic transglycosylase [Rhodovulum sulfidophilum]